MDLYGSDAEIIYSFTDSYDLAGLRAYAEANGYEMFTIWWPGPNAYMKTLSSTGFTRADLTAASNVDTWIYYGTPQEFN